MALKRYKFAKLVRDRFPDKAVRNNVVLHSRVLDTKEYIEALKMKLVEEGNEVLNATSQQELIEEIADVVDVLEALYKAAGISSGDLKAAQTNKFADRGGFEERIYVDYGELDDTNSPFAPYYKARPDEYPEISD